jgi:hypothetical protein
MQFPVAARLLGIAGLESRRGHGCLLLSVVCCQVQVSASDRSLVQRTQGKFHISARARVCVCECVCV